MKKLFSRILIIALTFLSFQAFAQDAKKGFKLPIIDDPPFSEIISDPKSSANIKDNTKLISSESNLEKKDIKEKSEQNSLFNEKNEIKSNSPDSSLLKKDTNEKKELKTKQQDLESSPANNKLPGQNINLSEKKSNDPLQTQLPNTDVKGNKTKKEKGLDPTKPPYDRGNYQLNRQDNKSAAKEFNVSSTEGGEFGTKSKLELVRLLALERKKNEADSIISSIENQEEKYKALFELAAGLYKSANEDKNFRQEAIPVYLLIITEAPKENSIVPKAIWALANLLYSIEEYLPALDHLSSILMNYKDSEYIDDAIYLSGKIYEESYNIRDYKKAKIYYNSFLKNASDPRFKGSIYMPEVKKRLSLLNE